MALLNIKINIFVKFLHCSLSMGEFKLGVACKQYFDVEQELHFCSQTRRCKYERRRTPGEEKITLRRELINVLLEI